jgi:hypothetical protein
MSVLTTMALMVTAIAKNLRADRQDDRVAELEAQIAKIADDRDMWRERALERIEARPPQAAGPDFRPPQLAQAQLAQWQQAQGLAMAQYAQQQAQQYQQNLGMQQQNYLNQGLLGAQGLQMPAEWCNCVPARHDMFLSGNGA